MTELLASILLRERTALGGLVRQLGFARTVARVDDLHTLEVAVAGIAAAADEVRDLELLRSLASAGSSAGDARDEPWASLTREHLAAIRSLHAEVVALTGELAGELRFPSLDELLADA